MYKIPELLRSPESSCPFTVASLQSKFVFLGFGSWLWMFAPSHHPLFPHISILSIVSVNSNTNSVQKRASMLCLSSALYSMLAAFFCVCVVLCERLWAELSCRKSCEATWIHRREPELQWAPHGATSTSLTVVDSLELIKAETLYSLD